MAISKEWLGVLGGHGNPYNLTPSYSHDLTPVDNASEEAGVADPLNSTQLYNLQDEDRTAHSILAGTQATKPGDLWGADHQKEFVSLKMAMPGYDYSYGAKLQFDPDHPPHSNPKEGPWHMLTRLETLSAVGVTTPASQTLGTDAALMDDDVATASVSTTAQTYAMVGVKVGIVEGSVTYAPAADAIIIWGSIPIGSGVPVLLGSNDNASWTEIDRSTYAGSGFGTGATAGAAIVTAGHPLSGTGILILFAQAQTGYAYYAIAWPTGGLSTKIAEVAVLSKYGDLSISSDHKNYVGLAPTNAPVGTITAGWGSYTLATYVFPDPSAIVAIRWQHRGLVLRAASADIYDDAAGLSHIELYSYPMYVDLADADGNLITEIDAPGEPGDAGDWVPFQIINQHPTLPTASIQLWVAIDPQTLTDEALPDNVNSFNLPNAGQSLTQPRYILNIRKTAKGSFGDSGVSFGGGMAGWTEDNSDPPGANKFHVDYDLGIVYLHRIGLVPVDLTPADATADFAHADFGAQVTELSEIGSGAGTALGSTLTLSNGVIAASGGAKTIYVRTNMTGRTEERGARRRIIIRARFGAAA